MIAQSNELAGLFHHSAQFYYVITDLQGRYIYMNPLFQKRTGQISVDITGAPLTRDISFNDIDKYHNALKHCIKEKDTVISLTISCRLNEDAFSPVSWDISCSFNDAGLPATIQWVGVDTAGEKLVAGAVELPERYKAYEQSFEGLWCFDLRVPVAINLPPEEIIEHCRQYSFLSECNDTMARMYGFDKAGEFIGATMDDLLGMTDPARMEYLKEFIKNGYTAVKAETKEYDRYGKTLYFLNNMTGIIEDGLLKRVWGTQQDITDKRNAEEQLRFQAGLYNSISDAVTSSDMDLTVTSWNKGAEEIYGIPATEILGKKLIDLLQMDYHQTTRREVIKTVFENKMWSGEVSFMRKTDQTVRTILATITLQENELKQPVGIIAVNKDITERKKAENQLRYQNTILNNVSDLILTLSFDMHVISWNKKAEEVVGYTAEETRGKFIGDIIRPDYGSITASQSAKYLEENGFWQGEISFFNKYGVKKYVLHTASYLLNETGKRIAIIGTGKDITEKKKAEENLQQSELFYRNLIAHSLDGVLVTDEKGMISFASPSITEILGYEIEETIGKLTFDFAHPEDKALAVSAFRDELLGTPQRSFVRLRLQKKSGEWVWCIVRGHNLMENPYVRGMIVDFYDDTLRKKAEDALIESEKRFRYQAIVLQNVTDVIVTTDLDLVVTSWNKISEELSGITAGEVIGKPYRDIIPLDFAPYTREQIAETVFSNHIWQGEVSFISKKGEKKYLLHTISLLQDEEGKSLGILGVGKDITERKKIEAKLQESEQFYRDMISNSLDGIVTVNIYGQITYCGPSVTKLSGYEPEQLMGRNLFEFVHPDDMEAAREAYILEFNKQSKIYYIFLRLHHSDGSWVWCSVRGHNLFDKPGINAMIIYFTDETKRKATEDRLRESEQRFRHLIDNLKLGVILLNIKGDILICNQACFDIFGTGSDTLTGTNLFGHTWNVIDESGNKITNDEYPVSVAMRTKKNVRDVVLGIYQNNINCIWLLVNVEPVLDASNQIYYVICSFSDITEQKKLSRQLIEAEIQKQKQLMQATIDGQEKERKEIGLELHDNISQHITTTRLYLEVARDKATGEVLNMINQAHKGLLNTVNEMRQLSQALVPPSLSDIGLTESIEDLCSPLKNTHAFSISFHHHPFNEALLPENMKLMIFRIIQEQINNIIRHSGADTILISLQTLSDHVKLSVSDNGKGFDPATVKKGLGFDNISNRASLFGGKLQIDTAPGKGCSIHVTIPLSQSI
jgi:PAS domain S-box-containing protein